MVLLLRLQCPHRRSIVQWRCDSLNTGILECQLPFHPMCLINWWLFLKTHFEDLVEVLKEFISVCCHLLWLFTRLRKLPQLYGLLFDILFVSWFPVGLVVAYGQVERQQLIGGRLFWRILSRNFRLGRQVEIYGWCDLGHLNYNGSLIKMWELFPSDAPSNLSH